ncbi:MAG: pentapeptide repeat-containing protein [Arenibacterium sp.]
MTYKFSEGNDPFEGIVWEGTHLDGAQLDNANFKGADLYWAGFFQAQLNGANFENANLQGADPKEASCVGANFRWANLGKDNLSGRSQLQGADLTGAILNRARLEGAEYDQHAKFPKGFRPSSHGMIGKTPTK